jgi:glycosyltransferase involved in cell wall biosynthesis
MSSLSEEPIRERIYEARPVRAKWPAWTEPAKRQRREPAMRSKPTFGSRAFGKRDAKLLLVAYFDPNGIETIPQSIEAWQSLSRHEIVLLNMWPGRAGNMLLPETLDLGEFDGVILHPTVSYLPSTVRTLDAAMARRFEHFDGIKALMKQDEQVLPGEFPQLICDKGFDIVFTVVPTATDREKVYPRSLIGDCTLVPMLTGYVWTTMRAGLPKAERDLDVSYRGSIQPLSFGRLGYEKRGIGCDMATALAGRQGIRFDISSRWKDRHSGAAWDQFLARSKTVLGVESGANIFDFDGRVAAWCNDYAEGHRDEDAMSYAYYRRAHDAFLHTVEGNVDYAQISPRHFEAAAAGAAQVLYEGNYSGILKAGRHFFPLRRDLGNLEQAIDFIRDEAAHGQLAEQTYEEVVLDRRNWYESFVTSADDAIDAKLAAKGRHRARPTGRRPLAYVLAAHDPVIDPRISWFASSLNETHDVVVVGTYRFDKVGSGPSLQEGTNGIKTIRVERTKHDASWLPNANQLRTGKMSVARALLGSLIGYAAAPTAVLDELLGSHIAVASELARFRTLCAYMVNTNSALLGALEQLGAPDLIVAADLETLFAAVAGGEDAGCPVVFDAHEYWPYSVTDFQHWEIEFWSSLEARLAAAAQLRVTVTPQLAAKMSLEYGSRFLSLPNAATRADGDVAGLEEAFARRRTDGPLRILYQGGFAHGRGLEEVVRAWQHVKSGAILILRGPDNEYRRNLIGLARSVGVDAWVEFPDAVPENALIGAALEADIGLIPYNPAYFIYRFCCPNKLSQYAAAGLPVLTSGTEFVARTVKENNIGYTVDIADPSVVAALVDELAGKREELVEKGRRARAYFEHHFNWDVLAAPVFAEIEKLGRKGPARQPDLSWIGRSGDQTGKTSREASPLPPTLFGARVLLDMADAEAGASVTGSSPFHPRPNDADYLLRHGSANGYAAVLSGAPLPHWIEFDLGTERAAGEVEISWYREDMYPTRYRVLRRESPDQNWQLIADVHDNSRVNVRHPIHCRLRFIRLEASSFKGDPRLLVRSFRITPAPGDWSLDQPAALPQEKARQSARNLARRILAALRSHR